MKEYVGLFSLSSHFFNLTIMNIQYIYYIYPHRGTRIRNIYNSMPKNNIKLIMCDMNAKISIEQQFTGTTGRHSFYSETNENGRVFDTFCY